MKIIEKFCENLPVDGANGVLFCVLGVAPKTFPQSSSLNPLTGVTGVGTGTTGMALVANSTYASGTRPDFPDEFSH